MPAIVLVEAANDAAGRRAPRPLRALNLLGLGESPGARPRRPPWTPSTTAMSHLRAALAVRSLEFIRPYRRPLGAVLALALVLAALSALDPLVMKYLFDQLGRPNGAHAFAMAI